MIDRNAGLSQWATWREIQQQPDVWLKAAKDLAPALEDHRRWIAGLGVDEVWFSGAGTSAYIGDILVASLPEAGGMRYRAISSTDLVATPRRFLNGSSRPLLVSFGRSGNSTESRGALELADRLAPDMPRLNITCNRDSLLAGRQPLSSRATALGGDGQRVIVLPEETHDAGFAMTSSFTTMLLTALAIFGRPDASQLVSETEALSAAARCVLSAAERQVPAMQAPDRIVFVGSGPGAAIAREAALKVMELTAGAIPALSESSLGFRHGPKSFVTDTTLVVQFAAAETPARLYDADLAAELRGQYGPASVTTIGGDDSDFPLPDVGVFQPLLQILLPQTAAVIWSEGLGLDVDNPFSSTGRLSRVVAHVALHTDEG